MQAARRCSSAARRSHANDPDYITGIVTTSVLSGYSGRLNQEVRVKRGLSYGAGAQLIARREAGLFLGSTLVDHTRVLEAASVMRETIAGLAAAPPADTEMVTRKATVSGGFSRSIETLDGVCGRFSASSRSTMHRSRKLNSYLARVEAVTALDVQTFTQKLFGARTVFSCSSAMRRNSVRASRRRTPTSP